MKSTNITPADLYIHRMVPLGQTVGLLHRAIRYCVTLPGPRSYLYGQQYRTAEEVSKSYLEPILDTLSLINCAIQFELATAGRLPSKMATVLDKELCDLQLEAGLLLCAWAADVMEKDSLLPALSKMLDMSRPVTVARHKQVVFMDAIASSAVKSMARVNTIWRAIGYAPSSRSAWLSSRIQKLKDSPLVHNGRVGYWLTLVGNMPWGPTYTKLGVNLDTTPRGLGSDEGRKRLPVLLATLPGYSAAMLNPPVLLPEGTVRIPQDVSVTVVDGLLVLARQVPTLVEQGKVDPDAWGAFCKKRGVAIPTKEERQVSFTCGAESVVAALSCLDRLAAIMVDGDLKLMAAFEAETKAEKRKATMAKLKEHFNTEELADLMACFKPEYVDQGYAERSGAW